jgi:hypothetical protein
MIYIYIYIYIYTGALFIFAIIRLYTKPNCIDNWYPSPTMSSESRVPQFGKRYISFYLHACGLISVLSERSNELTKTSIARVTTTILKALTKQRSTLLRLKMTKRMNRVSLVVFPYSSVQGAILNHGTVQSGLQISDVTAFRFSKLCTSIPKLMPGRKNGCTQSKSCEFEEVQYCDGNGIEDVFDKG